MKVNNTPMFDSAFTTVPMTISESKSGVGMYISILLYLPWPAFGVGIVGGAKTMSYS